MGTDSVGVKPMQPENLEIVFLQSTPALREKIYSYCNASYLSALNLYNEATQKSWSSPEERAAQVAVAAGRLAAVCELQARFFTACAVMHAEKDAHARDAAIAAVGPVEALHGRRLAQWIKEANGSLN